MFSNYKKNHLKIRIINFGSVKNLNLKRNKKNECKLLKEILGLQKVYGNCSNEYKMVLFINGPTY